MKLFRSFLLSALFVSAIFFVGCSEEPVSSDIPVNTPGLSKLTLPAGAVISSATLNMYVEDPSTNNVTVHKVNVAWTEAETWNTFYANTDPEFDAAVLGNFVGSSGLHTVDITALVQAWVNGTTANNGVLLDQPVDAAGFTVFRSSEYAGATGQPYLEVTYSVGGGPNVTVQEPAFIDTYILQTEPNTSFGNEEYLRLAHIDTYRKHVLVQFDIEEAELQCETAYAFGDTPFCGLPNVNNWGWTEYINGNYTNTNIPIYAGAAHCDPNNGVQVGTLSITYVGTSLTINYTMNPGVIVENAQIWIGSTALPVKNGKLNASPGQFTYVNPTFPLNVTKSNPFYIAAHFDVCF